MIFGEDLTQTGLHRRWSRVAVGGVALALLFPYFSRAAAAASASRPSPKARRQRSAKQWPSPAPHRQIRRTARRKQLQESLKQIEEREKQRKKRLTLRMLIMQAGLEYRRTHVLDVLGRSSALMFAVVRAHRRHAVVCRAVGSASSAFLGFPRWFLGISCASAARTSSCNDFADAIDVMVRGLKAGLAGHRRHEGHRRRIRPAGRAGIHRSRRRPARRHHHRPGHRAHVRAHAAFRSELPRHRHGHPVEDRRQPCRKRSSNLSKVLRDRKKMKAKIRAVSQEAKVLRRHHRLAALRHHGRHDACSTRTISIRCSTPSIGNIMLAGCGTVDADRRSGHAQDDQLRHLDGHGTMIEHVIASLPASRDAWSRILIGVAAFATVLTIAAPYFEGDKLRARMKTVGDERDKLRAAQRAALVSGEGKLRDKPKQACRLAARGSAQSAQTVRGRSVARSAAPGGLPQRDATW